MTGSRPEPHLGGSEERHQQRALEAAVGGAERPAQGGGIQQLVGRHDCGRGASAEQGDVKHTLDQTQIAFAPRQKEQWHPMSRAEVHEHAQAAARQ